MKQRHRAVRYSAIAFVLHGVLASGVLSLDWTPRGANVFGWDAIRLLRLVDYPVLWAIDGILQRWLILPAQRFAPHFEVAYRANVVLTYVLVGGIFYAGLTAGATLLWGALKATSEGSRGAATL